MVEEGLLKGYKRFKDILYGVMEVTKTESEIIQLHQLL